MYGITFYIYTQMHTWDNVSVSAVTADEGIGIGLVWKFECGINTRGSSLFLLAMFVAPSLKTTTDSHCSPLIMSTFQVKVKRKKHKKGTYS